VAQNTTAVKIKATELERRNVVALSQLRGNFRDGEEVSGKDIGQRHQHRRRVRARQEAGRHRCHRFPVLGTYANQQTELMIYAKACNVNQCQCQCQL